MSSLRLPSFILHAPPSLRPLLFVRYASNSTTSAITEHLPRIAQPSLWKTFVPRFLRRDPSSSSIPSAEKKPGFWRRFFSNPASGIIVLAMLTGNAAIHIMRVKRDTTLYSRKADQKMELLREVIKRVQSGEEFDVEAALGTGNQKVEEEWFDVIREIENEEAALTRNERQRIRRVAKEEEKKLKEEAEKAAKDGKDQTKSRPDFL